MRKTANPLVMGGMELPVTHAGRAEAAGKRKDLCVKLYIRNWVLEKRREDDYEMLKEHIGSRDTHCQRDPRLGKKQPKLNRTHRQEEEVSISLSSNPETMPCEGCMERDNKSTDPTMEFLLLGFSELLCLRVLLFLIFLVVHLVTLAGNMMIFMAVVMEPSRPPMLFFLCQLSVIELCYTLVIVPKALLSLVVVDGSTISFIGCAAQMHLFVALGGAECFLLVAMSYDRYVAICQPLHYVAVMSEGFCLRLAVACCLGGFAVALGLTVAVFRLPFCQSHRINHFFCDVPAVLHLACTQSYTPELPLLAACVLLLLLPFLLILTSYVCIAAALLHVTSSVGRGKAFSTCVSHLAITLLHYGCATFIYIRPKSSYSPTRDKMVSLVYTNITPLLYPLIYSLRNKEIRGVLRKMLRRKKIVQLNWDTIRAAMCACGKF
ncbi:olfactory receptor 10ac1 [Limosa lapponica baueri]|uniref:Olfactory receptor 10ac1 n=1 Tax=Limosa lapponica baueri TaxID=1758121 RepID=A0A2I0UE95_LIMLA|nr:olfactory receptor 10ac1 [Limosa lapponica baueri]